MALGDGRIAPGAPGPGRHVHTHEDEGIYVVAGVLTVEVGDERHEVGPESFIWLPREVPHVFANLGHEEVWTLGLISSPGLTGMFQAGRVLRLPPRPSGPCGAAGHQPALRSPSGGGTTSALTAC
ncbi:cupin domain-containing protein [Nocardioides astragali]|uniref:Cupin domain-containing protein n=2 Tax=Nocardioides astragali TaxID=1776736 RepID=A0ABW2MYM3_9ACTN